MKEESEKPGLKLNIQNMNIIASGPTTSWQIDWGGKWEQWQTLFSWAPKSLWLQPWNEKMLAPWKESYDKLRQCIKKHRHQFADKGPYSQSYDFSSSHLQMWELDHKEDWAPENWWFQTVALEKTLESPLDSMEIKPVNPKGKQPWIFIGRTGAEAPILWHWYLKQRVNSLEKTLMLGKIELRRRRGQQRMRLLDGITNSTHTSLSKLREIVKDRMADCCSPWGCKLRHDWTTIAINLGRSLVFRASLVAQLVKNLPAMRKTWVLFLDGEDTLEKGKAYPLQYSGLEHSRNCIVHGVTKSQTRLSIFHTLSLYWLSIYFFLFLLLRSPLCIYYTLCCCPKVLGYSITLYSVFFLFAFQFCTFPLIYLQVQRFFP